MHRGDHGAGGIGVVAGDEIVPAMLGVPQLEIGHVNVHQAVHQPDALEAIIGRGIIDQRQPQTALDRKHEGLEDLRHDVFRSDEVDVMAAKLL